MKMPYNPKAGGQSLPFRTNRSYCVECVFSMSFIHIVNGDVAAKLLSTVLLETGRSDPVV